MNKNFTTYEQSQRLLKFGVPADTADCYYNVPVTEQSEIHVLKDGRKISDEERLYKRVIDPEVVIAPCWSVGRLIEIFLKCGTDWVVDDYGEALPEKPSLHFISYDADRLVDMMISDIEDGDMLFSEWEK